VADELELRALVPDADAVRTRLRDAGAVERFRGRMSDRRYDLDGELMARNEVLRVRTYYHPGGRTESVLGWKGPVRRSPEGYKQREEVEFPVAAGASPDALLRALGYEVVHAMDRDVELLDLDGATLRLERYQHMDPLLEVEGEPAAIERAIRATGLPRAQFTADSLTDFVRRFEARTGTPAVLALP
jgi:adenylate cyclase class IV